MSESDGASTGVSTSARSKNLALVAMLLAVAMTFIDQTIVAIASPNIQVELDLSRSGVQWVVNSYLLALAAGFALGGRLADVLGSKRVVLVGIVGFAGTSGTVRRDSEGLPRRDSGSSCSAHCRDSRPHS